ncbi:hypothetical protein PPYR_02560 [Photinus pyralis]|uniref:Uncharacterized protein n=3 Tax=Photinus pyralis TaxID=7054 RepID=A0A5N4B8Q8_PHOPY|nr:hypothetical protein PPYR_02560 [Photinus pyralis]
MERQLLSPLDEYACVASLKFYLKTELLMEFFTKLALNETICPISNCSVTLADVTDAAELSKLSTNVLAKGSESLNLNDTRLYEAVMKCNMTVKSTLYYFQLFDMTFSEIYNKFVNSLTAPEEMVQSSLKAINVSLPDFMAAVAYGNDKNRLTILSKGNYSLNNVNAILNITRKNFTEIISCIPLNKILQNLSKVNSTKLQNFVIDAGITSNKSISFFKQFNISLTTFLKRQQFADIVDDIYKSLNKEEALGVFVARQVAITVKRAITVDSFLRNASDFLGNYSQLFLESVANPLNKYQVKRIAVSSNHYSREVAHIYSATPFLGKLVNISSTQNLSRLTNCTYVSKLPGGGLFVENITDAHVDKVTFTAIKSSKTTYNLGSPLFCKSLLYGLAIENYPKYIKFTSFEVNSTIKPILPGPNEVSTTPSATTKSSESSSNSNRIILSLILITTSILQL